MSAGPPEGLPGDIAYLRLPRPSELFGRRARRFRELAPANPMTDLLEALGRISEAQARAVPAVPPLPAGREVGTSVPLRATTWERGGEWRATLAAIVSELRGHAWPDGASRALERLAAMGPAEQDALADGILSGSQPHLDLAAAPFAGAALQVHFASLAATLPASRVERSASGCPVCGSPPVAGVVLGDDKLRYLACSLCGAEWHLTRVQCWTCGSAGGLRYLAVAGDPGGTKAEACPDCGSYLKLFYRERLPAADPVADDVATLTLDLLAASDGWARSGVNLFLVGGVEAE